MPTPDPDPHLIHFDNSSSVTRDHNTPSIRNSKMSVKPSSNQPQASASGSAPIDASHPMSTVINGGTGRILCVSDIRGDYNNLNRMVEETKAVAVIHTGDFGFLDGESPSRMLPR